ncbi:MAG: hypothetical protein ACI4EA_06240 [Candidatus Ornithomonoglobus sp.]
MNYIKQINALMEWLMFHDMTDAEFRTYMAILHCSNRLYWSGSIPNKSIEKFADKDKSQVTRLRKRLVELGLIEYENGKKGQAGRYKIKPLYENDTNSATDFDSNVDTDIDSNSVTNSATNSVTNPAPIIKQKTENKKLKTISPHTPQRGESADTSEWFNEFWAAYPRKVGKLNTVKAWKKLKPDKETFAVIMSGLEKQKQREDWRRDGGRYIPYPETWINGKRWEDEINITTNTATNTATNSDTIMTPTQPEATKEIEAAFMEAYNGI